MDREKEAVQLRESIRQMERKLGMLEEGEMSCCGISLAQCHALVEIGRAGSISLVELSRLLDLDNSTMSRTVNNLVNSGMAARELDPGDRRYVTIRLTEAGTATFKDIEHSMNSYFEQIFNSIPDNKKEQVLDSLQILLKAIADSDCCCL
jgi:DNA-binding MarR family transcriptional regulator